MLIKLTHARSKCSSSPFKHHLDRHKKAFKSEWLNTPNAYKKEEFDETGTPNPKKITKVSERQNEEEFVVAYTCAECQFSVCNYTIISLQWVPEQSPNKTSTPIKVEDPNQFAPQGSDPKELKSKHKEVCMKCASFTCAT